MIKLSAHIISESPDWVAINKPAGLLSIPDRKGEEVSLKQLLREKYGEIFTVHRLDRETSGVILFAKTAEAHQLLSAQFEQRDSYKLYHGLVMGKPFPESGSITSPIAQHPADNGTMIIHRNGKPAHTDYRLLESFKNCSWVEFIIHTGRTHQIRIHMKEAGSPIICDPVYGDGKPLLVSSFRHKYKLSKHDDEERPILARLGLHASMLKINFNGSMLNFEAAIPKDLRASLQQLRKSSG